MTITTVITTYQRPQLLRRAILSVLKQSYSNFQVCVYDNASNDQTEEIVQKIARQDSRVKYHRHSKNIGMMPNYEFAFKHLDSPYFTLLSDDDFLLPCFYETALEGLKKNPDAAFSACGILQMDDQGNFFGDPLSLWESEGYYLPEQGIIEMLKTRARFPIPTGLLFNRDILKNIHPNFNEAIDFFWDPDYLIRIAARYPIVINKKHCGVYLAHSQCYSGSFYSNLLSNSALGQKYFQAMKTVKNGILEVASLSTFHRNFAAKLFNNYVEQDAVSFMKCYINERKLRHAHLFAMKYYAYNGFSPLVALLHLYTFALKASGVFRSLLNSYARAFGGIKKFFQLMAANLVRKLKRITKISSSPLVATPNDAHVKEAHKYGKMLLEDNY
jgi:glycosyltransferase involved in cell wall biosynthesis